VRRKRVEAAGTRAAHLRNPGGCLVRLKLDALIQAARTGDEHHLRFRPLRRQELAHAIPCLGRARPGAAGRDARLRRARPLLRISGKRALSKLNAFDLVVTVALGSTLATALLSKSVALAEGVLALGLLIFLRYATAWLSVRSANFQRLTKAEPTLLLYRGHFLEGAMKGKGITQEEILAALRASGAADAHEIAAVVPEADGTLSVIPAADAGTSMVALDSVRRLDHARG
jgi:Protein of unknown function (DUF421)